ncbi:MAG: BREX-3 system phosphatase PglZ [Methylococcales bacterium]
MTSWRDSILDEFIPNLSKLTLVADPDNLLSEEKLSFDLRQRGFELIEFNDPVEFRYVYESKYRSIWDSGESTDLVVILWLQDVELQDLPYDLLQTGRKLAFDLGSIFPNLSYSVIQKLDRSLLDPIFAAQQKLLPKRMGDNATKDFILRNVFGIAAELILNEIELLKTLLRLHYAPVYVMPPILADRLVQVFTMQGLFGEWSLSEIFLEPEIFFAFLQERWSIFLNQLTENNKVRESLSKKLRYSGLEHIPFDHHDIRIYIDNLFIEGKLTPIQQSDFVVEASSWMRSGIISLKQDNDSLRITRLFELIEASLPSLEYRYSDWITFALKWAELSELVHCADNKEDKKHLIQIGAILNDLFTQWLNSHYASLINLPPSNLAMLHHLPRHLARTIEDNKNSRVALLVIDGLSLSQWLSIKQILRQQNSNLIAKDSAIFAWIPTLTSVSRQAIFAGKAPIYFSGSIDSTNKENNLWQQFWEDKGLSRINIAYQRGLGDGDIVQILDNGLLQDKTKVIGLVIDKVDKIMHGMQLGMAGMHNQIKQWCQDGFLNALIEHLLNLGLSLSPEISLNPRRT